MYTPIEFDARWVLIQLQYHYPYFPWSSRLVRTCQAIIRLTQHLFFLFFDDFLCNLLVCRPDMAAPREFIPTSGTTANWKTEHDAMYTPIEFDARWVLNGSSIIPFVLVHTYYAIVRLTQSLSLSLSPINRNLSVLHSSSDPIWLFRENLFLHRVLRPTGRQNMMQCILRLSSMRGTLLITSTL